MLQFFRLTTCQVGKWTALILLYSTLNKVYYKTITILHTIIIRSSLSCLDEESVEICTATCKPKSLSGNMPIPVGGKSLAPITIESGSSSKK